VLYDGADASGTVEVSPEVKTTYTLVATGPGGSTTASVDVAVAPVIDAFASSTEGTVRAGMEVELSWRTAGAQQLSLSNGGGFDVEIGEAFRDEGSLRAPVGPSGVFVLRAVNGDVAVTREIEFALTELPIVVAFGVDREAVTADPDHPASIQVTWDVAGADVITLVTDPGEDEVLTRDSGSFRVSVTETTSFRLVAENAAGTVERSAVVLVGGTPAVVSFEAAPTRVGLGESVEIAWDAVNAAQVLLEQDGANVGVDPGAFRGSYETMLAADSTFRLFVENVAGEKAASLPITVAVGAPIVETFTSAPGAAVPGADLELSWTNDGGTSLEVTDAGGAVVCSSADPANIRQGSCIVTMPATADDVTFTLAVTNGSGAGTADVVVGNLGGPQIDSFIAAPGLIEAGESIRFTWEIENDADGIIPTLTLTDDKGSAYDIALVHPNHGQVSFPIATPGNYVFTLEAKTPGTKPARAMASAVVQVIPKVLSFTVTPDTAVSETDPVLLSWTTQDAVALRLFQLDADGAVVGTGPLHETFDPAEADSGRYAVQPTYAAPDFLLEIENAAGTIVRQVLRVGVDRADVLTFTATPDQILRGQTSTLAWTTSNATTVELRTSERWVEIDEPFIDLTGMPGVVPFDLESVQSGACKSFDFPDGFTFTFDGAIRRFVNVCHPGVLMFDSHLTSATTFNAALPASGSQQIHLAPFWDDLSFTSQGGVILTGFVGTGADREFVVQYKNYSHKNALTARLNFEVVLRENGTFDFRYGDMVDDGGSDLVDGSSATIGWQNGLASDSVLLSHNTAFAGGLSHRSFHFPVLPVTMAPHVIPGAYVDLENATDATPLAQTISGNFGYANFTFPAGFAFPFAGADRTSVYVHAPGYLSFKASGPSSRTTNGRLLVGSGTAGLVGDAQYVHIAPYWQNLTNTNGNNGGEGGKLFYALRSDARGDYLVIQWKGYSGQGVADSDVSFEVWLREDGSFEYHYGPMTSATTPGVADGSLATIGFQDPKGYWGWENSFKTAIPSLSGSGLRFHPKPTIDANGSLVVRPLGSVEYLLEASNAGSWHEVGAQVSVETPVQIFATTTPAEPTPLGMFSIDWTARGVIAVRISDDTGRVLYWALPAELDAGAGSLPFPGGLPRGEHTFHLWAVGRAPGDEANLALTVIVEDPFSIDSFEAADSRIKAGESTSLSWTTTNATDVSVELLDGTPVGTPPLAGSGSMPVSPAVTTTYRLVVESHGRIATREVTVEVRTAWVDSVTAGAEAPPGGSVPVSWTTTGGTAFVRNPATLVEDVSATNPYVDITTMGATSITVPSLTSFTSVTLPFPFQDPTGGAAKTAMRVNPRGLVNFHTSDSTTAKTTFPSGTTADRIRMGVFWDSNNLQTGGPAGTPAASLSTLHVVDPTGPDAFIVQWKNIKVGTVASSSRGSLNFQLVLYDDGSFEYRYGTMAPGDAINAATANTINQAMGSAASIGFQRYTAGVGYQLSYNMVFPGGLENRSFRFGRAISGSGQANLLVMESTDLELCVQEADWTECTTRRIVVPKPGDLMITEIMAAPGSGPDAQWFEVRNLSPDPIDLDGKTIRSGTASATISAPGGTAVIASGGYGTLARSASVAFVPDVIYGTDIDLAAGDLRVDFGPATLAKATWDATWFQTPGASRSLDPAYQVRWKVENPTLDTWCEDTVNVLANGDFGTPGAHGSTCRQTYYEVDWVANLPFIDISETGTKIPGVATSFGYEEVPGGLAFDFPFFDTLLPAGQEMWAAMNGTLSFGYFGAGKGATGLGITAVTLPQNKVNANGLVVGMWDELRAQSGTTFAYETKTISGKQVMIFQWTHYAFNALQGSLTFQTQLWDDGDIVVVYAELTGDSPRFQGSTSTVGLEKIGGGVAIQGFYKQPVLFPGQAVLFRPKAP